jgi:protocatechuate 3,4-dioxygenase beta subunit/5-hydroxyisourate hydrolase-like protein (transthyretin family)
MSRRLGARVVASAAAALLVIAGLIAVFLVFRPEGKPGEAPRSSAERTGAAPLAVGALPPAAPPGSEGPEPAALDPAPAPTVAEDAVPPEEPAGPISIEGRVVDLDGKGIEGARVVAVSNTRWTDFFSSLEERFQGSQNPFSVMRRVRDVCMEELAKLPRTESKEDGRFAFHALAAGEYRLLASHSDFLPELETWVIVEEAIVEDTIVEGAIVEGNEPARVEIRLAKGFAIRGKVLEPNGQPLARAAVSALAAEEAGQKGMARMMRFLSGILDGRMAILAGGAETAEDGSFALTSLEPVAYEVTIRREGYAVKRIPKVPAGAEGLVVVLERGRQVLGRVLDPDAKPLAGAAVELRPRMPDLNNNPLVIFQADLDLFGEGTREVKTGDDGRFALGGLDPGEFDLRITKEGFPAHDQPVEVGAEAGAGDVDLGDLALEAAQVIAGRVVREDGKPLAEARVRARPAPPGGTSVFNPVERMTEEAARESASGEDGRFALTGLAAGEYVVTASAEGFADAEVAAVKAGDEDLRIVVSEGLTLSGVVLDARERLPVPGARVMTAGSRRGTTSGDDGRFELKGLKAGEAQVPPLARSGQVFIFVRHPDYAQKGENVTLPRAEASEPFEVLLDPLVMLLGVVVNEEREPVPGARVRVESPGMPELMAAMSGSASGVKAVFSAADGSFAVPRTAGGFGPMAETGLELVATHPRYASAREKLAGLELAAGEGIEIVVRAGSVMSGRVLDPAGEGVAGAVIRLRRAVKLGPELMFFQRLLPKASGQTYYSGAGGAYRIERLEEGAYDIEVLALGSARKLIEGFLVEGKEVAQDITLETGGSIAGRVVGAAGEPLAEVEVVAVAAVEAAGDGEKDARQFLDEMLLLTDSGIARARTASDGSFELQNLPDGVFSLIARRNGYAPLKTPPLRPGDAAGDLVLERLSSIVGRVADALTGAPVPEYQVQAVKLSESGEADWSGGFGGPRDYKGSDGVFAYEGVKAGRYRLGVKAPDYVTSSREVVVEPSLDTEVEILLHPGRRLRGVVLDAASGAGIPGVEVSLHRTGGDQDPVRSAFWSFQTRATTAEEGAFEIKGVEDGEYAVSLSHGDYYRTSGASPSGASPPGDRLVVPDAEREELRFTMLPAGRLQGRISGLPEADGMREQIYVELKLLAAREEARGEGVASPRERKDGAPGGEPPAPAGEMGTTQTWVNPADGSFEAASLRPGTYAVGIRRQTFRIDGGALGEGAVTAIGAATGGEQVTLPLGEVEIGAGRTARFEKGYPRE